MTWPRSPSCSTSWRRMAWGMGGLALAVAIAAAVTIAVVTRLARIADVREQRQLAGALDGRGDLILMPAARAGDPPRADLPAVGDELPQRGDVLVVDELDLVAAVRAGLAAPAAGPSLAISPARRPAALLCHVRKPLLLPSELGCAPLARARDSRTG